MMRTTAGARDDASMSALAGRLFPSLHGYKHKWLRPDLIAALTLWAVLVPEALAYAAIAGVSP
jgi:SulP family sulfate permease